MGVSPGGEFTSDEAAAVSGELDFSSLRIQSLKGIEYFPAIESLDCSDNLITRLDVSGNPALVTLTCGDNSLSTLDVSHNPLLRRLSVSNGSDVWDRPYVNGTYMVNRIRTLDVSNNPNLRVLECTGNGLRSLDVSLALQLEILKCADNNLSELDLSLNTELRTLDVSNNPDYLYGLYGSTITGNLFSNLQVSTNQKLTHLYARNTGLTRMILTDNSALRVLDVSNYNTAFPLYPPVNGLTELDISGNPNLEQLDFSNGVNGWSQEEAGNQISSIDVTGNPELQIFLCSSNGLETLDISQNPKLRELACGQNRLAELDVSHNPALEELSISNTTYSSTFQPATSNVIESLDLSQNAVLSTLYCGGNRLTALDLSYNPGLRRLNCEVNPLETLDLTQNSALMYLYCAGTLLSELELSNIGSLSTLSCNGCALTSLDLSQNSHLRTLNCYDNRLVELNLSNLESLYYLDCSNNQLTEFDISGCPNLSTLYCNGNRFEILDFSGNTNLREIYCQHNELTSVPDVSAMQDPWLFDVRWNNLDEGDCEDLAVAFAKLGTAYYNSYDGGRLGQGFAYSPQKDNVPLDCGLEPTPTPSPTARDYDPIPTPEGLANALHFRAYIDGSDYLHIRGGELWYEHRNYDLPGRNAGNDFPTYVNGYPWQPEWLFGVSLPIELVPPMPDESGYSYTLELVTGRGSVTITQQPEASNDYETIILFDDDSPGAADWYTLILHWLPTGEATPTPMGSPTPTPRPTNTPRRTSTPAPTVASEVQEPIAAGPEEVGITALTGDINLWPEGGGGSNYWRPEADTLSNGNAIVLGGMRKARFSSGSADAENTRDMIAIFSPTGELLAPARAAFFTHAGEPWENTVCTTRNDDKFYGLCADTVGGRSGSRYVVHTIANPSAFPEAFPGYPEDSERHTIIQVISNDGVPESQITNPFGEYVGEPGLIRGGMVRFLSNGNIVMNFEDRTTESEAKDTLYGRTGNRRVVGCAILGPDGSIVRPPFAICNPSSSRNSENRFGLTSGDGWFAVRYKDANDGATIVAFDNDGNELGGGEGRLYPAIDIPELEFDGGNRGDPNGLEAVGDTLYITHRGLDRAGYLTTIQVGEEGLSVKKTVRFTDHPLSTFEHNADLGVDSEGNVIVIWQDQSWERFQTGRWEVLARVFDHNLEPLTSSFCFFEVGNNNSADTIDPILGPGRTKQSRIAMDDNIIVGIAHTNEVPYGDADGVTGSSGDEWYTYTFIARILDNPAMTRVQNWELYD